MGTVRSADHQDYSTLYYLLTLHNKVAKEAQISYLTFEDFQDKIKNIVTFLFEENGLINSFMITFKLQELPIWVVRLVVTRPTDKWFKPESNGIADLYDYAINYWESQGLTAFGYVQPKSHFQSGNKRIRKASKKLQSYTGFTLYEYQKNKVIEHSLSKKIAGVDLYMNDVVIRIHYKLV